MKRPALPKHAITIVCVAAGTFTAPAVLQLAQNRLAERRIDAALAETFPRLTHGPVRLESGRSRIVVEDIAMSAPGVEVTLGRMVLPLGRGTAFGVVASASAQDNAVSADSIRVVAGKSAILIPHMEARGTSLDAGGLAAIFDASKPASAEERLAQLTAKTLTAPEVSIEQPNDDPAKPAEHVTVRNIVLTDVVKGKIGSLTASGMTLSSPTADKPPTAVESGQISATNIDLPLALTIANGSRSDKDMRLATLYDSILIDAFKISDADALMTIGRISSTGAKGRPLLRPIADMVRIGDLPDDTRTEQDKQTLVDVGLDMTRSFTLAGFEIRDFVFKGNQDGPIAAKFDRIGLSGFAMVKMASFGLDGFALSTKDAIVSLGHYGFEGYDQTALVDAMLSRMRQPGPLDMHAETFKMARPAFDTTSMTALHVDVPSRDGAGNGPGGGSIVVDFPAASIAVDRKPDASSVGTSAHAQMLFAIAPSAASETMRQAADAGFNDVDLNADYAFTYNGDTEDASIDTLSFDAKNLAAVRFGGQFGKVSSELMNIPTDPDQAKEAMNRITLRDFKIVLTNAGLVEKVLPMLASQSGMSVPIFKAQIKGQAQAAVVQALGATPTADRISTAVGLFIDEPKSLTLTLKMPEALSIGDIAAVDDPHELLDKVQIDAVANE